MKKHMSRYTQILAVILLGAASSAYAAQDGVYVGASLGQGDVKASAKDEHLNPSSSPDTTGLAWNAFVGYQMNANFAIELEYLDFSSVEFKNVKGLSGAKTSMDEQAVGLAGKVMFPLGAGFGIFATGGLDYVAADFSSNSLAKSVGAKNDSEDSVRPTYGIGASYDFYPGWSVQGSWKQITSGGSIPTSNYWGFGAIYHFG